MSEEFGIALGVLDRGEGMQVAEFRPGNRDHFRGGVELHRARAERNHAVVERQIASLQPSQVTHHLRFGVVRVEHRVGEKRGRARDRGSEVVRCDIRHGGEPEHGEDAVERGKVGGFIERDTHRAVGKFTEQDSGLGRVKRHARGDTQSVEEELVVHGVSGLAQNAREGRCGVVHALRDRLESLRAVIDGIH